VSSTHHSSRGIALLTFTTFLWGTTFIVTKHTLDHFPASELILGRFLVAGIIFLPFLRLGKKLWLAAFELGFLLWVGFATQTIGLRYTTVDRSAFITAMHVIFVPVFAGMMGRSTRLLVWLAALVSLAGVGLLSHDGSPPNRGDLWTLACAISWIFGFGLLGLPGQIGGAMILAAALLTQWPIKRQAIPLADPPI